MQHALRRLRRGDAGAAPRPNGTDRSTFALADVLAGGDSALPHGAGLDGETRPGPLVADDRFATAVAPAGALWSSASDMARYLQTELADGVAPDGTRGVSAANLALTRAPRVAIPVPAGVPPALTEASRHYGMGWLACAWRGLPLVSHSGGTLGFVSELAFLPEAGVGVVVLTNGGQGAGLFTLGVQFRLFELLFGQPAEFDALEGPLVEAGAAQTAGLRARLRPADPAAVTPWLGRYTHPTLGEVELAPRDRRLVFDAGELRPVADEAGQADANVLVDPPRWPASPPRWRSGGAPKGGRRHAGAVASA